MSTLRDDIQDAVRGATCWIADQAANGANDLIDFLTSGPDRTGLLDPARDYWQDRVGQARDDICSDGPTSGSPPPPGAGFTGGQCEGVNYRVDYDYYRVGDSDPDPKTVGIFRNVRGPIESIEIDVAGNVSQILLNHGGGSVKTGPFETSSAGNLTEAAITSVSREDGLPDDCGDPPNPNPQPYPIWESPRPNPVDPTQPDVPINVWSPRVDVSPDGDIEFCFQVDYNGLSFTYCYSPGYGDPEGSPSDPVRECCPDLEVPEDKAPPTTDDPPPPESARDLVGIVVSVTGNPLLGDNVTERGDGVGPSTFLPAIADLRFAVRTPVGAAWTPAIRIQGRKEVHLVPGNLPAYDWAIDEWKGVPVTATPIYTVPDTIPPGDP